MPNVGFRLKLALVMRRCVFDSPTGRMRNMQAKWVARLESIKVFLPANEGFRFFLVVSADFGQRPTKNPLGQKDLIGQQGKNMHREARTNGKIDGKAQYEK